MKVWIVSVGEPLPSDGEFVRLRRMGNLATHLSKNSSNSVEWFSASFDHYKKVQRVQKNTDINISDNYILHLLRVNGYKRNISPARVLHHYVTANKIYRKMEKHVEKPDVIIASMEPLEVADSAVKFAKKHNIPVIIDVRDLWPEIYYEVIPKKLHCLLDIYVNSCKRVLKRIMKGASGIVGLSEAFLEYGLKYAGRDRKNQDRVIPIAYPNYDYSKYRGKFELIKDSYGIKEGDFLVSFLGNFGNQFQFEEIIEAAKLLSEYENIKFVLCGVGVQMEKIKMLATKNIIFTGWIEKEEIMSITANSSIGIAPYIDSMNYRMNTPNKFGEYLSASLPIIISVSGVMEDLLNKNSCGKKYSCGKELADIILEYYNNSDKLKSQSVNARELYENMFNGDNVNQVFENYLITIAKGEN